MDEDASGIFDVIEQGGDAHAEVLDTEVNTEPIAEGAVSPETNTTEPEATEPTGEAPQGEPQQTTEPTETVEPSKTETQTEVVDWKQTLPPAPVPYTGPVPEIDPETGQIANMSPQEYTNYIRESAVAQLRLENYTNQAENAALAAAEQILPEIKTSPLIRQMVENARVASIINGQQIDSYQAAEQVREALGISPAKIAEAKAEATRNAKVSIEVQSNATLESGTSKSSSAEPDSVTQLQKRIKRGDDEAFAELLGLWEEEGKIQ